MNLYFRFRSLAIIAMAALFITSCEDDNDYYIQNIFPDNNADGTVGYLAPIDIPDAIQLVYGEDTAIRLSNDYIINNASYSLDFSENDVMITDDINLTTVLSEGIQIDTNENKLIIDSQKLYPNGFTSTIYNTRLPDNYTVTLTVEHEHLQNVSKTFTVNITPATLIINGVDNDLEIPYAYHMYGEENIPSYTLQAPELELTNTEWNLHINGYPDNQIYLDGDTIKFLENAGDPDATYEWTYDMVPELHRNGFTLARKQFRVMYLPQIKFFYGTYYADLDLTILTNVLYMGLYNEYQTQAPALFPETYKDSFYIAHILKDGVPFENEDGIISINSETGVVSVAHNHVLTAGSYVLTITAVTTTGLEFEAELTLNMEEVGDGHDH